MTALTPETIRHLIQEAAAVRLNARTPFTGFKVGAAILGLDGNIYRGCNMEIANMMLSLCAERAALARMTAEGAVGISAVAVIADMAEPVSPCGICRQTLSDFGLDIPVIMATTRHDRYTIKTVSELLPHAFTGSKRRDLNRFA